MVKLHRVFESDLYLESKKDLDDLKAYLGDKLFDDYMKIRDRIPKDQNEYKDFSKLKKMDKKDVQDFIHSFQSKSDKKKKDKTEGAEKIYEDSDWVVYEITTYPAAQLYGKGTKWCISGRDKVDDETFFEKYFKKSLGWFHFYISKRDKNEKYCMYVSNSNGDIYLYNAEDKRIDESQLPLNFPTFEVNLPSLEEVIWNVCSGEDKRSLKDIQFILNTLHNKNIDLNTISFIDNDEETLLTRVIDAYDRSPDSYNFNLIKLLLSYGMSLDTSYYGNPLIFHVIDLFWEDKDMLSLCFKYIHDLNIKNKYDETLLSYIGDNKDILDILKKYGAKEI